MKHLLTAALTIAAGHASASLVLIGPVPSTGNGIGAVNTSLTLQNTGTESGCVAFNGTTSTRGAASCPAGFAGGNESPGASQTNVFTAAQLNFSGTVNFSNLVVLFNGNEGGAAADQAITLNLLGLSLYSSTGALLRTFTTTGPINFAAIFSGVGNAGFGFQLDAAQAAQANAILAANPLLRIGTSATLSGAQGGPETIQLTTIGGGGTPDTSIPEPSTVVLLSAGMVLIGASKLRKPAFTPISER